ncbi:DUF5676 family membrane protein [Chitinimonas sp.]|uniref:DUF5676 family membrane protein n=1 Tax=Chitinimonas sp. TaxID=1934313 RepID=UPI002F92F44C
MSTSWKTGLALAITMAFSYTVCAVLYALWPAQGIAFLNALFHGLDFGRLALDGATAFTSGRFAGPLVVLTLWGFIVGTVFAWLYGQLNSCKP